MAHTVEILSVGTELLLGNIANTDAQMLSQGLSALGLNVYWHTVVGTIPSAPRRRWNWPGSGRNHHHHRRPGSHLRRPDQKRAGRGLRQEAGL